MDIGLPRRESGFTLIELAIAIVIVGLLLAGLLGPLSVRVEQQERAKTQALLEEIKEALLGYAAINGVLPCPTTEGNPTSSDYGVADETCPPAGASSDGFLPWKTLGVSPTDAWGRPRTALGDPWRGYWRYRVDRNFTLLATPITLTTAFNKTDALEVEDAASGNLLTTTTERPVAIIFSTGAADKDADEDDSDGENADYEISKGTYAAGEYSTTFDDITTWLSRPLLFNRMLMAGKLP